MKVGGANIIFFSNFIFFIISKKEFKKKYFFFNQFFLLNFKIFNFSIFQFSSKFKIITFLKASPDIKKSSAAHGSCF